MIIETGPNSWLINVVGDLSSPVQGIKQVSGKKHIIKKITVFIPLLIVTISQGTDATAEKTILQVQNSSALAGGLPLDLLKQIKLDANKSIVIGCSEVTAATIIIEGETVDA